MGPPLRSDLSEEVADVAHKLVELLGATQATTDTTQSNTSVDSIARDYGDLEHHHHNDRASKHQASDISNALQATLARYGVNYAGRDLDSRSASAESHETSVATGIIVNDQPRYSSPVPPSMSPPRSLHNYHARSGPDYPTQMLSAIRSPLSKDELWAAENAELHRQLRESIPVNEYERRKGQWMADLRDAKDRAVANEERARRCETVDAEVNSLRLQVADLRDDRQKLNSKLVSMSGMVGFDEFRRVCNERDAAREEAQHLLRDVEQLNRNVSALQDKLTKVEYSGAVHENKTSLMEEEVRQLQAKLQSERREHTDKLETLQSRIKHFTDLESALESARGKLSEHQQSSTRQENELYIVRSDYTATLERLSSVQQLLSEQTTANAKLKARVAVLEANEQRFNELVSKSLNPFINRVKEFRLKEDCLHDVDSVAQHHHHHA